MLRKGRFSCHCYLQVLNTRHSSAEEFTALVKVVPHPLRSHQAAASLYAWTLRRQPAVSGEFAGCWMTDSVQHVSTRFVKMWPLPE